MPGKRAARPPTRQRALRAGIAVAVGVVLIAAIVWSASALLGGKKDGTADQAGSSATSGQQQSRSPSPSASAKPSASSKPSAGAAAAAPAAVRACATSLGRAEKVVTAASLGVQHWDIHVQSRTDMLQGRMSVSMMDAMWKRTRLAGPADQQRFHTALDSYQPSSACARLATLHKVARTTAHDCATRYAAATEAVGAAKAAMADWKSHLDNMAAFAANRMTAAEAQTKWVAAWRNAPPHIHAYQKARTALAKAPACSAS